MGGGGLRAAPERSARRGEGLGGVWRKGAGKDRGAIACKLSVCSGAHRDSRTTSRVDKSLVNDTLP